jgi:hypothetical protein
VFFAPFVVFATFTDFVPLSFFICGVPPTTIERGTPGGIPEESRTTRGD